MKIILKGIGFVDPEMYNTAIVTVTSDKQLELFPLQYFYFHRLKTLCGNFLRLNQQQINLLAFFPFTCGYPQICPPKKKIKKLLQNIN